MLRNESVTFGNTQNYAAIVPDITKDIFSTKCYFFHNKYKLLLMIFFTDECIFFSQYHLSSCNLY